MYKCLLLLVYTLGVRVCACVCVHAYHACVCACVQCVIVEMFMFCPCTLVHASTSVPCMLFAFRTCRVALCHLPHVGAHLWCTRCANVNLHNIVSSHFAFRICIFFPSPCVQQWFSLQGSWAFEWHVKMVDIDAYNYFLQLSGQKTIYCLRWSSARSSIWHSFMGAANSMIFAPRVISPQKAC